MWTLAFWDAALTRAIRTFAQVAGAQIITVTAGVASGVIPRVDWLAVLALAGLAALLSLLTSVAAPEAIAPGPLSAPQTAPKAAPATAAPNVTIQALSDPAAAPAAPRAPEAPAVVVNPAGNPAAIADQVARHLAP
jgi:hypothetical protein